MKQGQRGFSLIELVAVVVMLGTLTLVFSQSASSVFNFGKANAKRNLAITVAESGALAKEIRHNFNRTRDYTRAQVGAVTPGFLVRGKGAIVLRADLRPCTSNLPSPPPDSLFNPATSTLAKNTSFVAVSCCGGNPVTRVLASPIVAPMPGGGSISLSSACGIDWGVTVATYTKNPTTGVVSLYGSRCFRDYISMNVSALGSQYFSGGASPLFLFDFVAQTSFSKNGGPSLEPPYYYNFVTSVGNAVTSTSQPLSSVISCSQIGEFN